MSTDPEHLERGDGRAVEPRKGRKSAPADAPETEPTPTATSPGARPCQMQVMTGGPDDWDAHACGTTPTVGGNGLYRYCKAHLELVERGGGVVQRDGWA